MEPADFPRLATGALQVAEDECADSFMRLAAIRGGIASLMAESL
jgi:hypothetical protein